MKKLIPLLLVFIIGITIFFVFFYRDKTLKYIPDEADMVILVDVKNLKRESAFSLLRHPSEWFKKSEMKNVVSLLNNSGIKTPDFLQIFHLKNRQISDWSTVLELSDAEKFRKFLYDKKFILKATNIFQKDQIFVKIVQNHCFVGTSINDLNTVAENFHSKTERKIYNANSFINGSSAAISFIGEINYNFAIEILEDEIEISSSKNTKIFKPLIAQLNKKNLLLNLNLDEKNTKKIAEFLNFEELDSMQIADLKMIANLESVTDTIITYEYDDNFNEVEKKSVQKITQPNYLIEAKSSHAEKTLDYLNRKKWINAENQIIAIPFQPNIMRRNGNVFTVKSLRKPIATDKKQTGNFIFFKNDDLFHTLMMNFSPAQKKLLSTVESVFYGNQGADLYAKIKFKKGKMPLILQ